MWVCAVHTISIVATELEALFVFASQVANITYQSLVVISRPSFKPLVIIFQVFFLNKALITRIASLKTTIQHVCLDITRLFA